MFPAEVWPAAPNSSLAIVDGFLPLRSVAAAAAAAVAFGHQAPLVFMARAMEGRHILQ